jgi:hypothetical protein
MDYLIMTIKIFKHYFKSILLLPFFALSMTANAGLMTQTLGNGTSGLSDGDMTTLLGLAGIQNGQNTPFDKGYGGLLSSFSANWLFNYAAITETILSATITIGIAEHDSQASGNQVASYMVDGNNMTVNLNTAFEAFGGADSEFNVYTFAFGAGAFAGLADGIAAASLGLQGPGLVPNLLFGGIDESTTNGAHLIFSTLEIVYQDAGIPPNTSVPEPSILVLFSIGLVMLGRRKYK